MIKGLIIRGPLSRSAFLRPLPMLVIVAAIVTVVFMIMSQLGYHSRSVQVTDTSTGVERSYKIVTVLPRDAIPAITNPQFVTQSEAVQWMKADEQVIGLSIGNETKAYPINMLSRHEIVNDVVGGKPLAITW